MAVRILLVEDEAITAMDLQRKLEFWGYDVVGVAYSGETAVELAEKHQPDLILMDIILRGSLTGVDVAKEIRGLEIPVVFISAHSEDSTMEKAREVEPYGYLIKPFDEKELLFTIELAMQRHRSQLQIKKLNRSLRMLSDCNQAIVRINDPQELLREICRIIVEVGGYRMAWIGFAEDDEERSVGPAAEYGFHEGYLDSVTIRWDESEYGQGPTGRSIREGKPVIIRDTGEDPRFVPWRDMAVERGFMSVIGLPLRVRDETIGALTVYSGERDAFDEEEVKLLMELAGDVSFYLESREILKEMEEKVARTTRRERILKRIFELSPVAILNFRINDGEPTLIDLNRAASTLTGVEECSGSLGVQSVLRGIPEDDLREIKGAIIGDVELEDKKISYHGENTRLLRLEIVRPSSEIASVFLIDVTPEI
ncbi:transcriptional regulator [Methanothermobacter thermautotrophicus]|uniref:Transcriptional regulator n=1 Tax=Methanothermobacter thermautotrophicus TaxID=145262 RepID=A0A842YN56_METTF|nr:GAF domain-containing protein [Methanothermobacter thermautotrophicus]MBE2899831.1 transcriptional regulator [Methanothermobacter thermautotrophicus]